MQKRKYYHKKLIRDKIPEVIENAGGDYKVRVLNKKEFKRELKKKLIEEAKELSKVPGKKVLNELADVLELLKSISTFYRIDFKKVEKKQIKKRKERGGFKKRLFLLWSTGKSGK